MGIYRKPAFVKVAAQIEEQYANRSVGLRSQIKTFRQDVCRGARDSFKWVIWITCQRLRLPGITSEGEITEQAAILCKDYIQNKLKRSGLVTTNDHTKSRTKMTNVSRDLQYVGSELEQLYPTLFKDVCRQLNVNLTSETIVDEIFTEVSSELFATGITWARVVAMFAVAGSIATECFQQGNVTYVNAVVNCLTNFVRNHLALWISQRGGWSNMACSLRQKNSSPYLWTISLVGAACGIAAGTVMMVTSGKL